MKTLSIALRNLLRNGRRSIATLLGISIGAITIILFGGYKANINYAMQTGYVRLGGHLQIQHKDYFLYGSGNPTGYSIADYSQIIAAIKDDPVLRPMILIVTPKLQFGGVAGNYSAGVSRTVVGNGIIATEYAALQDWNQYDLNLDPPEFLLKNSPADSAVVGLGLARVLQLCKALKIMDCSQPENTKTQSGKDLPDDIAALGALESSLSAGKPQTGATLGTGQKVELLASNPRGAPNVVGLNVIHAETQGFKEFDEIHMVMHLDQAQKLIYGKARPSVTSIIIQLRDTSITEAAQARIRAHLAIWSGGQSLTVNSFGFLNPFYVQSIDMFDTIFGFIFLLIGGIVMFTVSNTMNTTVTERTVEIGTLRAIGMRKSGIRTMFVTEGAILGVAGAVSGLVLALAAAVLINHLNLRWLPPGSAIPVPLALSVWGETGMIVGTSVGLTVMATLSAWWPAYRAAGLNVVEALRHV